MNGNSKLVYVKAHIFFEYMLFNCINHKFSEVVFNGFGIS